VPAIYLASSFSSPCPWMLHIVTTNWHFCATILTLVMTIFRAPATWMFPIHFLASQSSHYPLHIHASACCGLCLTHSRIYLVWHSSWCYCPQKMGSVLCPETLVTNYQLHATSQKTIDQNNTFLLCKWNSSFSVFITYLSVDSQILNSILPMFK
jgi:hypothetical protein